MSPAPMVARPLRITNMAFKPALGELYKKDPVCTKIHLFEIQNQFFLGTPQTPVGRGHPIPTPNPSPSQPILPIPLGASAPRSSLLGRSNTARFPVVPHCLVPTFLF